MYFAVQLFLVYVYLTGLCVCQDLHQQQQQEEEQQEHHHRIGSSNPPPNLLLFYGTLLDDIGEVVEDARVQFWHADHNGNYFHPLDDSNGFELMLDTFSYFGTAATDAEGRFEFKTYRPGIYPSRPITHIHFKVFYESRELLTSQLYFEDEPDISNFFDDALILKLEEKSVNETDRSSFFSANKTIVVNMNKGGNEKLTPTQAEGPFYPLVDFFEIGNDMTVGMPHEFYQTTDEPTVFDANFFPSLSPSSAPPKNNLEEGNPTSSGTGSIGGGLSKKGLLCRLLAPPLFWYTCTYICM